MKRTKKIALTVATMVMALCLMLAGVFAAMSQTVIINGKITTSIGNPESNAQVAVTASVKKSGGSYTLYGNKPFYINQITFDVPDITLTEENIYLIHKFDFENHGAAITGFSLTVEGKNEVFGNNLDFYIGDKDDPDFTDENFTSQNFTAANFIDSGVGAPEFKTLFVIIKIKDNPAGFSTTANYTITIDYNKAA